jgi:hypothetical protein
MHIGDEWQYEWKDYHYNPPAHEGYATLRIVSDTVMENGKRYFLFQRIGRSAVQSGPYRLDTASGNLREYINSTWENIVPLNWAFGRHEQPVLGEPTEVVGGGYVDALIDCGYGFGIVSQYIEDIWPYRATLLYARINGKEYGTYVSVPDKVALPRAFQLNQNYPNPFNPSTTIRYGLPGRSYLTLTVFNTLGQQVVVLQNGEQEAGYHEVKFDGSRLSGGVYFYRLQAGSFVQTCKLLLVR